MSERGVCICPECGRQFSSDRWARIERALKHYADEGQWVNRIEYKAFPGFHGAAVAQNALLPPPECAS